MELYNLKKKKKTKRKKKHNTTYYIHTLTSIVKKYKETVVEYGYYTMQLLPRKQLSIMNVNVVN